MNDSHQHLLSGRYIIGIDPAKVKHQAVVLAPDGQPVGKSFCFDVSFSGYTQTLWHKVALLVANCNSANTIFAIETSCNLWVALAWYLHHEGFHVA